MFSSEQTITISGDKIEDLKESINFILNKLGDHTINGFIEKEFEFIISVGVCVDNSIIKYPMKVTEPMLCEHIYDWLKHRAKYDMAKYYDGDGSNHKGWIICIDNSTMYDIIKIIPHYEYYAK